MFVLGVLIYAIFIRPLKQDRTMLSILVTFAVALVIEGVLTVIFGTGTLQDTGVVRHAVIQDW